ncbi:hypothetical protein BGZ46_007598 [Entomortierella lignicola]|nr:hypothetical protein BGZ46_007598 [Entomortierella lignicola]
MLDVTHVVTTRPIPSKEVIARMRANSTKNQIQSQMSSAPAVLPASNVKSVPPGKLPPKTTGMPAASNDSIVFKAMSFGIHVWSLDRVTKLLAPLMLEPIAPVDSRNLQELLRLEKLHGLTTNQNDEALKADFHVFKEPYLLVEDITGHHRPIVAQEYEAPKSATSRPPWPKIYIQRTERTPFVHHRERSRQSIKQAERAKEDKEEVGESKAINENTQAIPLGFSLQGSPSALVSGIIHSVTSTAISTNPVVAKAPAPHGLQHGQDKVIEQLGKRILSATKIEAGVTPDSKKSEFIHPVDLVKTTKPNENHEQVLPRKAPLMKQTVGSARSNQPTFPNAVESSASATLTSTQYAVATVPAQNPPTKDLNPEGPPVNPAVAVPGVTTIPKVYFKQGYCENCRQYYVDFSKHIDTPEHRKYAQDPTKFEHLDKLLLQLQRKPKILSKVLEPDTTVQNTTEHNQEANPKVDMVAVTSVADSTTTSIDSVLKPSVDQQEDNSSMAQVETNMISTHPNIVDTLQQQEPQELEQEDHSSMAQTETNMTSTQPNAEDRPQQQEPQELQEPKQELGNDVRVEVHIENENMEECAVESVIQGVSSHRIKMCADDLEEDDEVSNELSSELSRLDVSGPGEVGDEEENVEEYAITDQSIQLQNAAAATDTDFEPSSRFAPNSQQQAPFSDRPYMSESNASQLGTEATQPDVQFLDGSPSDSQVTDPVVPIHLSELCTDSLDTSPAIDENTYGIEGSSEEDRDGSDDVVALLKSPSAGRGVFARIQSVNIERNMSAHHPHPTPPKESFKRKLESAMAEDEQMESPRPLRTSVLEMSSTIRPIIYDDNLRSRLLSQQARQHQVSQRCETHDSSPQFQHQQTISPIPPLSFPSKFEVRQRVPQTPVPRRQSNNLTPSSCVSQPCNVIDNSGDRIKQHDLQHQRRGVPNHNNYPVQSPLSSTYQQQRQYSSPQSPSDINYSDHGYRLPSSPSRSPSQRYKAQLQFPVMTHAEQERERFYHHYRGNRLPEPAAGQKKMKSSTSLEDAYEEYGEGCMVFIE